MKQSKTKVINNNEIDDKELKIIVNYMFDVYGDYLANELPIVLRSLKELGYIIKKEN